MRETHNYPGLEPAATRKGWTKLLRFAVAGVAISTLLISGGPSWADRNKFYANLSGGGEDPPNHSTGQGYLVAIFDTDTNTLNWTVHYFGLTGSPIAANFHGPISYNGFTSDAGAPIQIGVHGRSGSPFEGSMVLDAAQIRDLKALRWYFNVHTRSFPGGEIRGPLIRW